MQVVGDFLKRRIVPLQRRARLCCWFTSSNDIGRIQRGHGTDLSWEELELLVKGITGEPFVPESLILPQDIPTLYDDLGLRSVVLATLPTLDDSGVAVHQTGGWDPLHGIRIPGVPARGPQPTGPAPGAGPAAAPSPLDKGKGATSGASTLGSSGGSKEERRRRLRRADGLFVSDPPPEASEDCWWGRGGQLPGPGHAEARQSSATTTIGPAATTTTTTIGPAATTTTPGRSPPGAPVAATTAAVAPLPGSLESPGPQVSVAPSLFFISLFIMPTGLNPSFACQGFLPLCP
jgi:hypothetical protein